MFKIGKDTRKIPFGIWVNTLEIENNPLYQSLDFKPVGPRMPKLSVIYFTDKAEAKVLFQQLKDSNMFTVKDWNL